MKNSTQSIQKVVKSYKPYATYRHLIIRHISEGIFNVNTKRDEKIGMIQYDANWKCWIYLPMADTQYSADCLKDISNFLKRLDDGE